MANEIIRPTQLPARADPVASEVVPSDNGASVGGVSWKDGVNAGRPMATRAEAEAGVVADKAMSPLTTKQAITSQIGGVIEDAIPIRDDKAVAASTPVADGTDKIIVLGEDGGTFVASGTGAPDFTTPADAEATEKHWWREADVNTARFERGLHIAAVEGPQTVFDPNSVQNDEGLAGTVAVKLEKPPFAGDNNGSQGICFVPQTGMFYSTWNRPNVGEGERINICRHDRFGELIDYGETTGPGSTNFDIELGHGQDIDFFYDERGNLLLITDDGDGRGATILEYQQAGSYSNDDEGYDIIVLAGQSNMAGVASGSVPDPLLDVSDPDIFELRNGSDLPSVATEPLGHPTSNANGYGPGPGLEFAKAYKARKITGNRKVLLLPVAVSSSAITDGGPWAVGGVNYNRMIARIATAMGLPGSNRVVALLWSQGETDANRNQVGGTSATTQEYREAFHPVIDGFRASTPSAEYAPVVVMGMVPEWVGAQSYRQPVQTALETVPNYKKWTAYSPGPAGMAVAPGDLHFSSEGNRVRGRLAFDAWLKAADNTFGVAGRPVVRRQFTLQPSSVTAGTVKLSLDKKFVLKSGGPIPGGGKNFRMFRLSELMNGSDGDRSNDFAWEMKQPDIPHAGQGWLSDGVHNYHINGTKSAREQNWLTIIRIADKQEIARIALDAGQSLAKSQNGGVDTFSEPEGAFWVVPYPGAKPQIWMGVGMASPSSSDVQMFALPLFQRDVGALSGNGQASPLGIGINLTGEHKIAFAEGESLTFSTYHTDKQGTHVEQVMELVATGDGVAKLRFRGESNGVWRDVLEINRANGALKTGRVSFGGSLPALGTPSTHFDTGGGGSRIVMSSQTDGGSHIQFRSPSANAGVISSTGNTTNYGTTSDMDAKLLAGDFTFEQAVAVLSLIQFRNFSWKSSGETDHGVFAQELYDVYPKAVIPGGWFREVGERLVPCAPHDESAQYIPWQVDYSKLMTVVARCVQGIMVGQDQIEARLAALEGK